jgi:hypothetical protein
MTFPKSKAGLLQTLKSVLASGIGVQSAKNRGRGFSQDNPVRVRLVIAGLYRHGGLSADHDIDRTRGFKTCGHVNRRLL